jgi:hypothetical protein
MLDTLAMLDEILASSMVFQFICFTTGWLPYYGVEAFIESLAETSPDDPHHFIRQHPRL